MNNFFLSIGRILKLLVSRWYWLLAFIVAGAMLYSSFIVLRATWQQYIAGLQGAGVNSAVMAIYQQTATKPFEFPVQVDDKTPPVTITCSRKVEELKK